jgi:cytochrome c oxidase subunit 2
MKRAGGNWKSYIGAVLLLVLGVALVGCTPDDPQSTFGTSGPVARSQLVLFYWIFWAAVFVFIAVGGFLLYTVIRYRRRPGDADPEQTHGNTPLEIGWTILPAVILAVVAVPTVITIFDNANSPDPGAMTVEVIGHQWWWEFKYPHPTEDGEVVVVANEMHIPVAEVVNIVLDSKDVLHSFWIPKLAGKVDMVPNNRNTMWIQADEAGEFHGQCAEFCGEAHAKMKFRVIAEPRAEFDAWLAAQAGPAPVPEDGSLAYEGRSLFEGREGECWVCHTVQGSDRSRGTTGPNLSHLASRALIGAGVLENTETNLRAWLESPEAVKQGTIMFRDARVYSDPDRKLSDEQISALVEYLSTLK